MTQIEEDLSCSLSGIPLTYDIFSGGRSEKTTFLSIVEKAQETLKIPKIIVVADRGINTSSNMYGLSGDNGAYTGQRRSSDGNIYRTRAKNGFIFGQTVRNQSEELVNWIIDPEGYSETKTEDGEIIGFKSRIVNRTVKVNTVDGRKTQRKIRVKELAYYNSKYDRRSKHERADLLEKAQKLSEDAGTYNQKSRKGGGKYIQNNQYAVVNGKKVKATIQELEVDYSKAKLDELLDGYYCLVTSELEMEDTEIWASYHELHDIENCFRVTKSEFDIQPVYVWTEDSINAHVLICFVSLLIYRILKRLSESKFSSREFFEAIREFSLTYAGEGYYLSDEQSTNLVESLGRELGLEFKDHYMKESEIRDLTKY